MARSLIAIVAATFVVGAGLASPANAGGMGRFLGGLLARGAVGAVVAGSQSASASTKSYTPDVLTVQQLASCIKKATKLDGDSTQLELDRGSVREQVAKVESSSAAIESQRSHLDRHSKASVNAFNRSIDDHNNLLVITKAKQDDFNSAVDRQNGEAGAYNAECAKKYYSEDLADAQKLAANN